MSRRVFEFIVIDQPIPMGRKRVFTNAKTGAKVFASEPKDVRSLYMIRQCFLEHYPEMSPLPDGPIPVAHPNTLINGPVRLSVRYWHKAPGTMSKKKRIAAWMKPVVITKPDIPNLIAQVADALTGYAYVDDNRIAWSEQMKFYAIDQEGNDTPPRMSITVEEL